MGTPRGDSGARRSDQARIEIALRAAAGRRRAAALGRRRSAQISADRLTVVGRTRKPARTLVDLVRWIDQLGVELADVQLRGRRSRTCSSS